MPQVDDCESEPVSIHEAFSTPERWPLEVCEDFADDLQHLTDNLCSYSPLPALEIIEILIAHKQ